MRQIKLCIPQLRWNSVATPRRVLPSLSLEGKTAIGFPENSRLMISDWRSKSNHQITVLIEGGLGKEFLKAFAISGARSLAVIDRNLPVAIQACGEIRETAQHELGVHEDEVSEVDAWGCDVTNTDEVHRTIDDIGKKFGRSIDILVAAAGNILNIND